MQVILLNVKRRCEVLNNLTDQELINILPATDLETELIKRLSGSTEQDWDELHQSVEESFTKARETDEFCEKLRDALRKVATEIHRCAEFGTVEITPEFRKQCEEVVCFMGEFVAYEYPKESQPKNNTSSFRAGGTA